MTTTLYLTTAWLDHGETNELAWRRKEGDKISVGSGMPPEKNALVVVLPVEWVTVLTVPFPGKNLNKFGQAAPFLIEDKIAQDVEDLHIAWGGRNAWGQVPVIAIDKEKCDQLLQRLKEEGYNPEKILVDALLLPEPDESPMATVVNDRLLIRSPQSALALPLSQASLLASSVLAESGADKLVIWGVDSFPGISVECRPLDDQDVISWLLAQAEATSGIDSIDLLQGPYQLQKKNNAVDGVWKPLAAAAVISAVIFSTYFAAMGWLYQRKAESSYAEAVDLYRDYFPQDKKIIDLRSQAEGHLQRLGNGSGEGFMATYRTLGAAWKDSGEPSAQIRSLRYQKGLWELEINTPSLDWVQSLIKYLRDREMTASLLSASDLSVSDLSIGEKHGNTLARIRLGVQ